MILDVKKVLVIMARKCMSDKEMLAKAEMSASTWNQIKNGKCNAKTFTIGRIAKGLNVDVTDIIKDETKKE